MTSPESLVVIDHVESDAVDFISGSVLATEQNDVTRRLFDCVRCRDVDGVVQIYESPEGASVDHNSQDDQGHTCMRIAVEDGSVDIVKVLLQHGVDVNGVDFYGKTPLQYAAENGHCDIVRILVDAGAPVDFIDERLAALHTAVFSGQIEATKLLIDMKCDVNVQTKKGISALHCAVAEGHTEVMRLLLAAGALVNLQDQRYRRTPIFLASEVGNVDMISELIQHGAKLNVTDKYGMTPLNMACIRKKSEAAKLFIQAGTIVNMADDKGNLPLHFAARSGDADMTLMLLDAGSKIDVLNKNGDSPLHLAVRMQHTNIVQILVAFGCFADIQVFDCVGDSSGGLTPLYVAIGNYNDVEDFEEVLMCLIDGGCQLDTPVCAVGSVDAETVLYRALDFDKVDFAKILLRHGADVDVECPHGVTILNKACQRGMSSFVRLLTASSWRWSTETWLASPAGSRSGFRPRNLGRFLEDTFDESEVPMVLWNRLPLYSFLRDTMSRPPSLQQCCRTAARRHLAKGGRLFEKIDRLVYPTVLKDFLKLRDVK